MNDNLEKILNENLKLKEENSYLKKILEIHNIKYSEYIIICRNM